MLASCDVVLAGEHVQLLGQRAMFWPARRLLAIADVHLGKDDVFREAGIAMPAGGTRADLTRLSELLALTGATRLRILGDFIHGTRGGARWRMDWQEFRACHDIRVELVLGNHDGGLDTTGLGVEVIGEALVEGPFNFRHDHGDGASALCISGHVHPVVRLPRLEKSFPVFHLQPSGLTLPAFSAMTGGWKVPVSDAWVACVEGQTVASPQFLMRTRNSGSLD
ncbi:MAG: ligase-associated DNA damage response endonuclease PdeM [Pseudomonadota bacterium]|nr:ligase-associated DNA damage response endonuclease PdeM [Pseudomonadota bacterium]MDQ3160926.1 ligase-associated DNA damage response endonuclease PdeM [Pseudomonadota bacterium]